MDLYEAYRASQSNPSLEGQRIYPTAYAPSHRNVSRINTRLDEAGGDFFVDLGAKFPWPPPLQPKKISPEPAGKKPPAEDLTLLIRLSMACCRNGGSMFEHDPPATMHGSQGVLVNVEPEPEKVLALFFPGPHSLRSTDAVLFLQRLRGR